MARNFTLAGSKYAEKASAVVGTTPLSMACWVKSTDTASLQYVMGLFSSTASTFEIYAIRLRGNVDDKVDAVVANNTAAAAASLSGGTYSSGVWYHVAGVFAGVNSRLIYLDGVAGTLDVNTLTVGTVDRTTISSVITGGGTHGFMLTGDVAEPAYWNVELTAADVLMLSKGYAPSMVRPGGLVSYAPFWGQSSPENDLKSATGFTLTNSPAVAAHPRVFYPHRRLQRGIAAAAATGKPWLYYAQQHQAHI